MRLFPKILRSLLPFALTHTAYAQTSMQDIIAPTQPNYIWLLWYPVGYSTNHAAALARCEQFADDLSTWQVWGNYIARGHVRFTYVPNPSPGSLFGLKHLHIGQDIGPTEAQTSPRLAEWELSGVRPDSQFGFAEPADWWVMSNVRGNVTPQFGNTIDSELNTATNGAVPRWPDWDLPQYANLPFTTYIVFGNSTAHPTHGDDTDPSDAVGWRTTGPWVYGGKTFPGGWYTTHYTTTTKCLGFIDAQWLELVGIDDLDYRPNHVTRTFLGSPEWDAQIPDGPERMDYALAQLVYKVLTGSCLDGDPWRFIDWMRGDVNWDCSIDSADLALLLADFGSTARRADLNQDGTVNTPDLGILLTNFGT